MTGAGAVQLDLFGEVEKAEREASKRERTRAAWLALFEQPDWIAPWDTAGGMKKGDSKPGWRCPDPACGEIEPNEYWLLINHGWDPFTPGQEPFDGRCHKLRLLRSHAEHNREAGTA